MFHHSRLLLANRSLSKYCLRVALNGSVVRSVQWNTTRAYAVIKSNGDGKKKDDGRSDFKINVDEFDKKLKEDFEKKETMKMIKERRRVRDVFTTPVAVGIVGFALFLFMILSVLREQKLREMENEKKKTIGKAKIGGPWELVNTDGKLGGSEELKGHWLLLYFGFTNCPDVCPDSIEKMVEVVDMLEKDKEKIEVIPVFITVDPDRDSAERVDEYCKEFSPKILGYTGTKEQIDKVTKTFRVYYSLGPKTPNTNDYIVDHTVIMYLIDPEGQFLDYYGQNRTAEEIAKVIKLKVFKREVGQKKKWL